MTNWPALAATIAIDGALLRSLNVLLGEPDRLLEKFHDRRTLARSNLEANKILPTLGTLYEQIEDFKANNVGTGIPEALLALGYADTLGDLTDAYSDYVRLERLPSIIRRAAFALALTLGVVAAVIALEAVDIVYSGDVIARWLERTAGVIGVVAGTLAFTATTFYYRGRFELARLLETHA